MTILNRETPVKSAIEFWQTHKNHLHIHQGNFYEWREGPPYRPISIAGVTAALYTFMRKAKVEIVIQEKDAEGHTINKKVNVDFRPKPRDVREVLHALQHLEGMAYLPDDVNPPAWLNGAGNKSDAAKVIALQNGILDLETGELLPHVKEFFSMTVLPFDFNPEAECPRWEQFVSELYPNCADGEGTKRELQKAIGYLLSSDTEQQKIFLVIGPKRSGKGTTMRMLKELLGAKNVISSKLRELHQHFGKAQLIGMKAAFFPDERMGKGDAGIVPWLLSITGGDDVSIPRKNLSDWHGTPTVRLWIATNQTPGFEDAAGVIASRFIVFKLTEKFFGNEDLTLDKTLKAELPGILNWALEGLAMLKKDRVFIQPPEAADVIERMGDLSAPALKFMREHLIEDPDAKPMPVAAIYEPYEDWCKATNHPPQIQNTVRRYAVDRVSQGHIEETGREA